jgi:hypothetical protein
LAPSLLNKNAGYPTGSLHFTDNLFLVERVLHQLVVPVYFIQLNRKQIKPRIPRPALCCNN